MFHKKRSNLRSSILQLRIISNYMRNEIFSSNFVLHSNPTVKHNNAQSYLFRATGQRNFPFDFYNRRSLFFHCIPENLPFQNFSWTFFDFERGSSLHLPSQIDLCFHWKSSSDCKTSAVVDKYVQSTVHTYPLLHLCTLQRILSWLIQRSDEKFEEIHFIINYLYARKGLANRVFRADMVTPCPYIIEGEGFQNMNTHKFSLNFKIVKIIRAKSM